MSVDLTSLIAKKRYLIPLKACDLCQALLKQLNVGDDWVTSANRPKSSGFKLDYPHLYARVTLSQEEKPLTPENVKSKMKKYLTNPFDCWDLVQRVSSDHRPAEVSYIILEERTDECVTDVRCIPMLYYKVARQLEDRSPDKMLTQDVRIQSEEFLDEVFIGGLGGKEIAQRKESVVWELMINDVSKHQVTGKIYEMLEDAASSVLLMGWVGTELIPKLKELKDVGVSIKAITHKPSERKAPVSGAIQKGYTELVKLVGLENVSVNPLLHGRAIIVDNKALVGSMDFNAHSLSGEHIEFAIYTEDVVVVRSLRTYFEKMFKPLKE